jgi:hypothetical protein
MSLQKGTSRKLWFSVSIRIYRQWRIPRCLNPLSGIDRPDPVPAT